MARTKRKHCDVNAAFIFYCQPDPKTGRLRSQEDVADHFGVSRNLVGRWSSKGNWQKRREEWGKELVEEAKIVILDQIEAATDRHLKSYVDLESFAVKILQRQAQAFEGTAGGKEKFSVWAVSEAAKVMKDAINGQRVILGLPTDVAKAEVTTTNRNLSLPPDQEKEFDDFILQNGSKKPLIPILNPPAHQ